MNNYISCLIPAIRPQFDDVIKPTDDGGENSLYYKTYCYEWQKQWKGDLKNQQEYDEVDKKLLIEFLNKQTVTILKTTQLFELVDRLKEPNPSLSVKIESARGEIEQRVAGIGYFENQLKHRVKQKEHSLALDLQYDLMLMWQESLNILKVNCQVDVFKTPLGSNFKAAEKKLKKAVKEKSIDLRQKIKENEQVKSKPVQMGRNRDHEKMLWFQVGLKFATGEIKKYPYPKYSVPQIAEAVGLPKGEKYILAGINGYKTDKDVYASRMKMQTIIKYCQENNIPIDPDFLSSTPPE